jgi:hypothetical protein
MTSSLSYPLTKFRYFTQLLTTTPICVVSEIANSCGYRVDGEKLLIPSFLAKVTQLCYNAAVVEYPHDVTEENGSAIAIFINNDFPWPISYGVVLILTLKRMQLVIRRRVIPSAFYHQSVMRRCLNGSSQRHSICHYSRCIIF